MNCSFSSDTVAPVCPKIMEKLTEINCGCEEGYCDDPYTKKVRQMMQKKFSKPVGLYFVANGSAANILSIKAMKNNYSSIICCEDTHINRYEVGGVEYNTGCKIVACQSDDAKLTVDMIKSKLRTKGSMLWSMPEIVVISQSNEFGLNYSVGELTKICDFCHKNDLYVFIDGARLANAMVELDVDFKQMLEDTGVDIATFGVNKNGAMFGEMIIILNKKFDKNFILQQKQSMHLFSKSRYLGAQILAILEDNLWQKNAKHANDMAKYMSKKLNEIGLKPHFPVQSNMVFMVFEKNLLKKIQEKYLLGPYEEYPFTRIMTNWSTTKSEIDEFIDYIKSVKNT